MQIVSWSYVELLLEEEKWKVESPKQERNV